MIIGWVVTVAGMLLRLMMTLASSWTLSTRSPIWLMTLFYSSMSVRSSPILSFVFWTWCDLKHGKIFLVIFVEVRDESCLGLVSCCLCLPLVHCVVKDS